MGFMDFIFNLFCLLIIAGGIWVVWYSLKKANSTKAADDDSQFKAYCAALNNTEMHNLIISGGRSSDRFLAVTSILNEANKRKIPTIVLHSGFAPFAQFSQSTYYDPCVDKDANEIAEIFTDAAANALGIDSVVHSPIKLIAEILQSIDGDITLSELISFPCDDVMGFLDEQKENGKIKESQYDKFKQRYNNPAVKDNILRVVPMFSKLKTLAQRSKSAKPVNLQQTIESRQILFVDLLADSNFVVKELIFSDINRLTEISKFWVITEGISFIGKPESKVDTVFVKNQNNITLIYSGEDVPVLTSNSDDTFETLVGGNSQLLIFTHISGSSAEKWAAHFGKENKTKLSKGKTTKFLDFNSKNTTTSTEKDYRFPPQHFLTAGKTTDINNRAVIWGLNEGECYFIVGGTIQQDKITAKGLASAALFGSAGITSLPRIKLRPTPLQIEAHTA
jgi:hypothetical protein